MRGSTETKNRQILRLKFASKGIDAVNFKSNVLNKKYVQSKITHIFKTKSRHAFPIAIPLQLLPTFSIT